MILDPMDARRCTATSKQSGERCKRLAIPGGTVCVMHGGASPAVRAAAEERLQEQAADRVAEDLARKLWQGLDAVPVLDPVAKLQLLAGQLSGMADELGARVNEMKSIAGGDSLTQLRAEASLLEKTIGHLRGLLVDMARLGIAEQRIQLEQDKARMVAVALQEGMDAVGMSPEQREVFSRAYVARLRIVDAGTAVAGEVTA
jgi:hypothetical protein